MKEVMNKLSGFEDLKNIETTFDEEEPYINLESLQEKTIFTRGPKHFSLIHSDRYWLFSGQLAKVEGRHYVQNVHKSSGQRNQWTTWILRTPCAGVKLLWQAMITNQLSKYSAEALKHGKKTSFVHAKSSLVLRGVLPKRTSRYEESSFVTCVSGPRALSAYSKRPVHSDSTLTATSKNSVEENSFSLEENLSKFEEDKLKSFKLGKEPKDGSYFSLTDNLMGKESKRRGVVRSKSFGNDCKDSIPFIDCVDENNSGTESNIIYIREHKPQNGCCSDDNALEMKVVNSERLEEVQGCKRTPKKKFPRLGTFERIKIEGRQTISEDNQVTRTCGTRTGTTAKHRRQATSYSIEGTTSEIGFDISNSRDKTYQRVKPECPPEAFKKLLWWFLEKRQ
ncbi:uncharacterized protein TNIN_47401 [Trichonephila inaurata madagascariensis]|uniref:Uncharacterized protein n=1 Tax=Trichonephila inaurata madagascariensis TaxID=2747483 RepID=A0A8X7BQZ8_9ARAC|nr:uncharacterized protein TNIN_47401 [Trichonephila inaurata madagascariensis]